MRNRAKCRKCSSVIESHRWGDRVSCSCGEIEVDGGSDKPLCYANDWGNFMRVDDDDNEIVPKVEDRANEVTNAPQAPTNKPTRIDLLNMLDEMGAAVERLPSHAMTGAINHYDWSSLITLLGLILRSDCIERN